MFIKFINKIITELSNKSSSESCLVLLSVFELWAWQENPLCCAVLRTWKCSSTVWWCNSCGMISRLCYENLTLNHFFGSWSSTCLSKSMSFWQKGKKLRGDGGFISHVIKRGMKYLCLYLEINGQKVFDFLVDATKSSVQWRGCFTLWRKDPAFLDGLSGSRLYCANNTQRTSLFLV